ncbi:PEP-CTERM sorting domain-containing protein [Erythrobacteraceae bacterium CFH 75059]|nr:SGNH/GDSL hydrolase family protein [Qipengyuania thermophila]TCD04083.1 PEP-CTERM sorting domain-containing protein [Erythrobacteraceae bacterium CFH 75059]
MRKAIAAVVGALALFAGGPGAAQTAPPVRTPGITSLTVFGDSLVDAGNVNALNPAIPNPALGYFQGRFTNGYNYNDLLSIALFGEPTTASLRGGTNFAFGGARATTTSNVPDLVEQLGLFGAYLAGGGRVDPTGLFILNFGGNDVFAAIPPGAPAGYTSDSAFLLDAARTYAGAVQTLNDLGARTILVTGFPNATPPGLAFAQEAEILLLSELSRLSLSPDTRLLTFSYLDFFGRLAADPTQFGLPANLNLSTTCIQARAQPDCTGFFSFDGTHPTAAVHQAVFQDMQRQFGFSAAVPEPQTWMLLLLGFGAIGAMMRRRSGERAPQPA